MIFELNVKLSEKDYFDFNEFWMLRSHYGKSQMIKFRIAIALIAFLGILCFCIGKASLEDTLVYLIAYAVVMTVFQLLFNKFMLLSLKRQIKALKKKGKMAYTPESTMQFGDSIFIETTPTERVERSYSALERVSILGDKVVYIHLNNVTAYIVPRDSFDSEEQYNAFLEFIKTKCANIDVY